MSQSLGAREAGGTAVYQGLLPSEPQGTMVYRGKQGGLEEAGAEMTFLGSSFVRVSKPIGAGSQKVGVPREPYPLQGWCLFFPPNFGLCHVAWQF